MKAVLMIASLLFLVSCATTSGLVTKDQCHSDDWTSLGAADGKLGTDKMKELTHACLNDFKLAVDPAKQKSYRDGFVKGLGDYCTYDNGKKLAAAGVELTDVCPPNLSKAVSQGYKEAKKAIEKEAEKAEKAAKSAAAAVKKKVNKK